MRRYRIKHQSKWEDYESPRPGTRSSQGNQPLSSRESTFVRPGEKDGTASSASERPGAESDIPISRGTAKSGMLSGSETPWLTSDMEIDTPVEDRRRSSLALRTEDTTLSLGKVKEDDEIGGNLDESGEDPEKAAVLAQEETATAIQEKMPEEDGDLGKDTSDAQPDSNAQNVVSPSMQITPPCDKEDTPKGEIEMQQEQPITEDGKVKPASRESTLDVPAAKHVTWSPTEEGGEGLEQAEAQGQNDEVFHDEEVAGRESAIIIPSQQSPADIAKPGILKKRSGSATVTSETPDGGEAEKSEGTDTTPKKGKKQEENVTSKPKTVSVEAQSPEGKDGRSSSRQGSAGGRVRKQSGDAPASQRAGSVSSAKSERSNGSPSKPASRHASASSEKKHKGGSSSGSDKATKSPPASAGKPASRSSSAASKHTASSKGSAKSKTRRPSSQAASPKSHKSGRESQSPKGRESKKAKGIV